MFVEAVCIAAGKSEPVGDRDMRLWLRRNCDSLLRNWRCPPGTADDGTIDRAALRAWVDEARQLLAEYDCTDIGDYRLGELLSGSPLGADGIWPAEPVRDIAEDLSASKKFERGLIFGKLGSRGITWRGMYDGGNQEAALADQFSLWAEQLEDHWPRTGRVLRQLAYYNKKDARDGDALAEERADEG
jgi:hypothetical protein